LWKKKYGQVINIPKRIIFSGTNCRPFAGMRTKKKVPKLNNETFKSFNHALNAQSSLAMWFLLGLMVRSFKQCDLQCASQYFWDLVRSSITQPKKNENGEKKNNKNNNSGRTKLLFWGNVLKCQPSKKTFRDQKKNTNNSNTKRKSQGLEDLCLLWCSKKTCSEIRKNEYLTAD